MNFWTVTLVSLAIGLLLVIGGALVVYMGSLVKSAYELKIEIQTDMAEGLRKIEEENDKKNRWVKRDLVEDIEKAKVAVQTDNTRRFTELADTVTKRLAELEEGQRRDRAELVKAIEGLRRDVVTLDQRLRSLRRDKPAAAAPVAAEPAPENSEEEEAEETEAVPSLPAPTESPVAADPAEAAKGVTA